MATPIPQNSAEFSLQEILAATGGVALENRALALHIHGVATDTREDLASKVYVALRGEHFDGHTYLSQAILAGARALVVDNQDAADLVRVQCRSRGVAIILVANTLRALGDLAHLHRERWGRPVVAVVGSAGKTTTRSVISALLGSARPGLIHSTRGNLNNRVGVPMILLGLSDSHEFAVVELGTNCPGEVDELGRITAPDVAVLTLIDLEHTEGLGDLDGVEKEESSLFAHLRTGGTAIGFGEDTRVHRSLMRATGATQLSYGFSETRDLQISEREFVSNNVCRVVLRRKSGETLSFLSPLVGRPGALAVAAGVMAVEAILGEELSAELCQKALVGAGEPGRNQVLSLSGGRLVIDDTYNSNPASVESSVTTGAELSQQSGGRLWLVLGEMLELGHLSESSHKKMGEVAARSGAQGVFFVQGDARISTKICETSAKFCRFHESADTVAAELAPLVAEGDVVVVKASRGVRAERVVQGLAAFFGRAEGAVSPGARADEGGSFL